MTDGAWRVRGEKQNQLFPKKQWLRPPLKAVGGSGLQLSAKTNDAEKMSMKKNVTGVYPDARVSGAGR